MRIDFKIRSNQSEIDHFHFNVENTFSLDFDRFYIIVRIILTMNEKLSRQNISFMNLITCYTFTFYHLVRYFINSDKMIIKGHFVQKDFLFFNKFFYDKTNSIISIYIYFLQTVSKARYSFSTNDNFLSYINQFHCIFWSILIHEFPFVLFRMCFFINFVIHRILIKVFSQICYKALRLIDSQSINMIHLNMTYPSYFTVQQFLNSL